MTAPVDIPQRILQAKLNAMWQARNRGDAERAQQLWREFTEAVSQRSEQRVKEMERERRIS